MQQSDLDLTMFFNLLDARRKQPGQSDAAADSGTAVTAPRGGILERVRTLVSGRRATARGVGRVGVPSAR